MLKGFLYQIQRQDYKSLEQHIGSRFRFTILKKTLKLCYIVKEINRTKKFVLNSEKSTRPLAEFLFLSVIQQV